MKIQNILCLNEQWLMEIEVDQITDNHLAVVPQFLKKVAMFIESGDDSIDVESINTNKFVGLMQSLRNPEVGKYIAGGDVPMGPRKVDMTPGSRVESGKSQQRLSYGFSDKQERDLKLNPRDLTIVTAIGDALATLGYFNTNSGRITNHDMVSLIRDFISASGETNPFTLLNKNAFNRAKKTFYEKKVRRVAEPDDSDGMTKSTKQLDMNSFVFAMSVANSQSRGKKPWTTYVDPDLIERARSTFEIRTNKQDAAENLLRIGFLTREGDRIVPNWNMVRSFKSSVNERIKQIIERGAKLRHSAAAIDDRQMGRRSTGAENYALLKDMIVKYVPSELYSSAKRSAISKIQKAFSAEGMYPELKNAVSKYLKDLESAGEFNAPSSGLSGYIQRTVEVMALKMVLSNLSRLLTPKTPPISIQRDLNSLKMNISKHMRRKARA